MLATAVGVMGMVDALVWDTGWFWQAFPVASADMPHRPLDRIRVTRRERPDILFIGNSHMGEGIRPALFDLRAGVAPPHRSVNFGISGSGPLIWDVVHRHYLQTPDRPAIKAVVIGTTPHEFATTVEQFHAVDFDRYGKWPSDVPVSVVGLGPFLRLGLAVPWRSWRYRALCNQAVADRTAACLASFRHGDAILESDTTRPLAGLDEARGFWTEPGKKDLPNPLATWTWQGEASVQDFYLRRLIQRYRSAGARTFLVWLPEYARYGAGDSHRRILAHMSALGADQVVDLSDQVPQSRYWHDAEHVTAEGATELTEALASRLGPGLVDAVQ
jgi:hypothetical protein